jgi:4-hydroxy-3-methylbut-2-en-1-yl diphosphate reductase
MGAFSVSVIAAFAVAVLMRRIDSFSIVAPSTKLITHRTSFSPNALRSTTTDEEIEVADGKVSKKEERLRMMKSDQFFRKGFKEVRTAVEDTMKEQFQSELVKEFKENDFVLRKVPGVTVHLAKDYGFCWGVERSIALAYEAVQYFHPADGGKEAEGARPTIHITNELIHNPEVNDHLAAMDVKFIEKTSENKKNFDTVQEGDVVILPAFGATFEEMDYFDKMVRFRAVL